MTWLGILYVPYLVVLLLVPLLTRWRWGLAAALIVTVAEVTLVVLVFYLLPASPGDVANEPPPQASIDIVRRWRERHALAYLQLVALAIIPALAALIGGTLSVLWSLGARVVRLMRARG